MKSLHLSILIILILIILTYNLEFLLYPVDTSAAIFSDNNLQSTVLFYNRIPKCGSTTLMLCLKAIRKKNNFQYLSHVLPREKHYFLPENYTQEMQNLQQSIQPLTQRKTKKVMYVRHLYFLNSHAYHSDSFLDHEKVQYFNLVKHPIEQFISYFYYVRYGWQDRVDPQWQHTEIPVATRNLTVDECILHPNCTEGANPSEFSEFLNYFCGHVPECLTYPHTAKSLEIAKNNIIQKYPIIGLTSDYRNSLVLFEKIMPNWFSGLVEIYDGKYGKSSFLQKQKTGKKFPVSDLAYAYLERKLKYEIELYQFIKARYEIQKRLYFTNFPTTSP